MTHIQKKISHILKKCTIHDKNISILKNDENNDVRKSSLSNKNK